MVSQSLLQSSLQSVLQSLHGLHSTQGGDSGVGSGVSGEIGLFGLFGDLGDFIGLIHSFYVHKIFLSLESRRWAQDALLVSRE